jgi:hypothetical protein
MSCCIFGRRMLKKHIVILVESYMGLANVFGPFLYRHISGIFVQGLSLLLGPIKSMIFNCSSRYSHNGVVPLSLKRPDEQRLEKLTVDTSKTRCN